MSPKNVLTPFLGKSKEEKYQLLLKLADELPPFNPDWIEEKRRVEGCQSLMYLHVELREGNLYFSAHSDALISKGLAALLIAYYNGMTPKELVHHEPTFLTDLGILTSLSPTRANGVASLWKKMKLETVLLLTEYQSHESPQLC